MGVSPGQGERLNAVGGLGWGRAGVSFGMAVLSAVEVHPDKGQNTPCRFLPACCFRRQHRSVPHPWSCSTDIKHISKGSENDSYWQDIGYSRIMVTCQPVDFWPEILFGFRFSSGSPLPSDAGLGPIVCTRIFPREELSPGVLVLKFGLNLVKAPKDQIWNKRS